MFKRHRLLVPLVVLLAAVTLTVGSGNTASSHTTVLTGTIDLTYSAPPGDPHACTGGANTACWVCNQAVDLDLVRINVDSSTVSWDGLKLMPGCTGRIGRIEIQTQAADAVKVYQNVNGDVSCATLSNCVHDLTIEGGYALSTNLNATAHQDCMHFMGGLRITVTHVVFACAASNNAQWFVTVNRSPNQAPITPPIDVVCDQCEFHPGNGQNSFHSVTIEDSLRSGVSNSLVCPGTAHNLQFLVGPNAQSPIDVNNAKPWPQGSDPRCWITDTNPPVLTLPGAQVAEATSSTGAVVSYSASATDPEEGSIPIACSPASGSTFPLGQTTVACSATDKLGHQTNGSFTVTVNDTTAPTVTVPANMTVEATGPSGRTVSYSTSASDLVDGSITPTCAPASGSTIALGTTTVSCSATDAHNNVGNATFTITVADTTAPTAPSGVSATASTTTSISAAWTASSDAVGVVGYDVIVNGSWVATTTVPSYTVTSLACGTAYTVAVDAFDAAGNVSAQGSASLRTLSCVVSSNPTTETAFSGTWTNPGNLFAQDGLLATDTQSGISLSARKLGGYSFSLPATAIIDKVELEQKWALTSSSGTPLLRACAIVNGTPLANHDETSKPTSLMVTVFDITADRAWTPSDFNTAGVFQTRVGHIVPTGTGIGGSYDYEKVRITYHLP